ncbi:propionyl-CoA carboxylase alpha chain/3-methylcrotonyl-CoA carboxylase alpha subunit [Actinomycetospora succinea]|uniref:Propionyl-CoA carboxylase alpha chain/3-methylcrotonyl-CoA carboxylase alpha subunit n=1 Tax=Actinomycetospora succinea TaxID=663603 RepID=A0A4R6UZK2_9PSEU|nr:biotin carboxylase N-terminal domain-containing protein [Actinomycetospora succinea]TDQ52815.1 propionyl-CoA carboxylase alpha chain/3-methylcrotonyl-CoA carboxylase alpha subunit [Actinomycetospora succinea]
MISTLLVANRGEIARRVIRGARTLGIRTVAIYSAPDADAPHVAEADRAVALRGSTSAETYLDAEQVLAAARATGADAVHPGYGFLSENAAFARRVADAGLTWVGPDPASIEAMGVKHTAKALAREAGVPTLPDALLETDDAADWARAAEGVGFPLLVKASAGGGGSGMREVRSPDALADAVRSARAEAARSFGDDTVFLERLLDAPRHIEIQVLGDAHGHVVHLGERECSIQRRHQKVVEEAPSPAVSPELRERMGATAVALAEKLGYVGAGTVEFLLEDADFLTCDVSSVDASVAAAPLRSVPPAATLTQASFYFLEMNTRLQVEHPVTEEVYGVDLVALQLAIADGEEVPFTQAGVVPRGHAIEVRLYAEDPSAGDRPSPGTLHRYRHDTTLRWEDALGASGEISAFYDPMIAKVIAHAPTRAAAARRLSAGLAQAEIHGPATNRDLLVAVLRDADFLAGETRTDFLEQHAALRTPEPATPRVVHLAAAVACTSAARRANDPLKDLAPPGWRLLRGTPRPAIAWEGPDGEVVPTNDGITLRDPTPDGVRVTLDGVEYRCRVAHHDGTAHVDDGEGHSAWREVPRLPAPDAAAGGAGPVSEVPGTVVEVLVAEGEHVVAGQKLVVLEAMKMEHPALAAADGVVETVHVAVGQYVEAHATLVTLGTPG